MVYQGRKTITDLGDKITDAEKSSFEAKIQKLEDDIKSDNLDQIKASKTDLETEFQEFSQRLYQQQDGQPEAGAPGAESFTEGFTPPGASSEPSKDKGSDDYVDVDYEVSDSDE